MSLQPDKKKKNHVFVIPLYSVDICNDGKTQFKLFRYTAYYYVSIEEQKNN